MKRIAVAFLLMSFMVSSCKKENNTDNKAETNNGLQGKWLAQELVETAFEGGVETEKKVKNTFTEKDYIIFNNDGTAVSSYEGYGLQHSLYNVSANTLTLSAAANPNDITKFEIKIWTPSDLVIVRELTEIIQNVRYTDSIKVSFRKM